MDEDDNIFSKFARLITGKKKVISPLGDQNQPTEGIISPLADYTPGKTRVVFNEKLTPSPTPRIAPMASPSMGNGEPAVLGDMEKIDGNFEQMLEKYVFPVTDKAGIPRALAASQTAIESGRGASAATKNFNNLHGIMTWDTAGNRSLRRFKSPAESAEEYVRIISKNFPQAFELRNEPEKMLKALQSGKMRYEGDNDDPFEYVRLVQSTPEWRRYRGK